MDIWIKRASRAATCVYCKEEIKKQDFMVIGKLWRKLKSGKTWLIMLRWHTQCYIVQGVAAIKDKEIREPKIEKRGRKKSILPDDIRIKRLKIMRRRASVLQRIKAEVKKPKKKQKFEVLVHLGSLLDKCKDEIKDTGGIPTTWD